MLSYLPIIIEPHVSMVMLWFYLWWEHLGWLCIVSCCMVITLSCDEAVTLLEGNTFGAQHQNHQINRKAADMQYHWCPSEIVDNGLFSSKIWSYWLIVNDRKKCTVLLSIRWEVCSTSDHAVRRSAQRFYDDGREWCHPLMSHHSGFP